MVFPLRTKTFNQRRLILIGNRTKTFGQTVVRVARVGRGKTINTCPCQRNNGGQDNFATVPQPVVPTVPFQ